MAFAARQNRMAATRITVRCLLVLAFLSLAVAARAQSVSIAWDPNTESDLAGYVVSHGGASRQYDATINVGLATTWTLQSPQAGRTYYFTVQAYNTLGLLSPPAPEVVWTAPVAPPPTVPPGPPFGVMDTPLDNVTGVTGALPVTGWALDDTGVAGVRIYRDAVAGEPAGALFVGNAVFIEGARPDVAAAYPNLPNNTRAGWGFMLLTNTLPHRGNGAYRFHAVATDTQGNQTLLGSRTIHCANDTATRPFGAIDTPGQGATASGTQYHNFGWVLSPGWRRADPPGGGSVTVLINGVPVGSPHGWTSRADLTAIFPAAEYAGVGTAAGVFTFDTSTLANGMHTIAWVVRDNQSPANAEGIGSRYFWVSNGQPAIAAFSAATADAAARTVEDEIDGAPRALTSLLARRGYDLTAPYRRLPASAEGAATLHGEELDRFELRPDGRAWTAGYLRSGTRLSQLPIGSHLAADGTFNWQPGPGFVGTYDFVFVRRMGGFLMDADEVRIAIHPHGSGRVGPRVQIDTPAAGEAVASGRRFVIAGWALDLDAGEGTGIPTLHAWAYPADGAAPIFLGAATTGGRRPDVAAVFGSQFLDSGYGLLASGLPAGDYTVAVFAWSAATRDWLPARTVRVTIVP
jgi:hypothetical protein